MLQNLNAFTIAPYGRIAPQNRPEADGRQDLPALEPGGFFVCADTVRLSPGKRMAALQLMGENGGKTSFYLDKAVELKPDTPFAILSLDETCEVSCQAASALQTLAAPQPEPLKTLSGELTLRRICTFFFQEHGPDFFFAGEQHSAYEFVYVAQGRLHTLVGGRDYLLQQNEALLIAPELWHAQYGEKDEGVSFFVSSFFTVSPLPENMLLRVFPERRQTSELMRTLLQESQKEAAFRDDMLAALFQNLLVHYARLSAGVREQALQTPASARNDSVVIDRAIQFIAENIYRKLSVGLLAQHCSVSEAYLSVLFGRHLNTSPGAYMLRARLEESRQMIRSGAGSMAQIARQLHFSSAPHFSAAFKRQYGMTPTVYAKGLR
jgi:AraC-like DNA-binding protein